jgi:hypothetical protein
VLLISRKFKCTAGKRWRNEKIAWGIVELNGADEVKPIFSSPNSPSCARRAQFDPTIGTLEQSRTHFLLQGLDLLAQRRLRDAKRLRSAAEVQFFGDSNEVTQMTQFHENPIRSLKLSNRSNNILD